MKKRTLAIIFTVSILIILYFQNGLPIKVITSFNYSSKDSTETQITIMSNKLFIFNPTEYADILLQQYKDNSLPKICLSTDLVDKPQKITFIVYTNYLTYKLHKQAFSATYCLEPDSLNYVLEID